MKAKSILLLLSACICLFSFSEKKNTNTLTGTFVGAYVSGVDILASSVEVTNLSANKVEVTISSNSYDTSDKFKFLFEDDFSLANDSIISHFPASGKTYWFIPFDPNVNPQKANISPPRNYIYICGCGQCEGTPIGCMRKQASYGIWCDFTPSNPCTSCCQGCLKCYANCGGSSTVIPNYTGSVIAIEADTVKFNNTLFY